MDCSELNDGYNFTAGNGEECGAFLGATAMAMGQAVAYGLAMGLFFVVAIVAAVFVAKAVFGNRGGAR